MSGKAITAFLAASIVGSVAQAEPAYTAAEILDLFSPTIQEAMEAKARNLCIGTAAECRGQPSTEIESPTLNLSVQFELDSAVLTEAARENLDQFAEAMASPRFGGAIVNINGYADARGSDEYNLMLSERRARSVVDYLMSKGITVARMIPRGFGESNPIVVNDPFDPANRRVETTLNLRTAAAN